MLIKTIKTRLDLIEKRIKFLPCKAHHVVCPRELKEKKYDNGDPWVECACGKPIIVLNIRDYATGETDPTFSFSDI